VPRDPTAVAGTGNTRLAGRVPRPAYTFISRLEEKGVSVAIAAELVGHTRVTTTQAVYTRMRGDRTAKLQAQRAALQSAAS
jgi:integrase